ncbi:MAG TPA: complex I NDUFA9 subunit family protein [Symbiobacteriaceae bacterium]
MASVLVAGGTGFIGRHIVRSLVARGHRVAVMSRDPRRAAQVVPEGVEVRPGDVRQPETLREAMAGVEVVVSAVQFPNHPVENPRKGYTYLAIDGEGTVRQVEAARAAGVRRFVYLSGAGTREGRTEPWFQAKLKAEKAIRESGMTYTIFRPSWVYGPEDRSLNRFAAFARHLPFVPVIGDGRIRVQPVLVTDLAQVVALSVDAPQAENKIYDVGGPEALTMNEILQTMLKVMGLRRPLLHGPVPLVKAAAAVLSLLPNPPLTPRAVDFILMDEPVDIGPLLRDFPIRLTPLEEGLSYLARH